MNRLVYLIGEPGVGKSTLMAALTCRWTGYQLEPDDAGPARILYEDTDGELAAVELAAVELGRRRDQFGGTDALPQGVIGQAERYVRNGFAARETRLLLAEGARLANPRFLRAATDSGWDVHLVHLTGPALAAARRAARAADLGRREQNPSWVKGRATADANLAVAAVLLGCEVLTVDAGRDDLPACVAPLLAGVTA